MQIKGDSLCSVTDLILFSSHTLLHIKRKKSIKHIKFLFWPQRIVIQGYTHPPTHIMRILLYSHSLWIPCMPGYTMRSQKTLPQFCISRNLPLLILHFGSESGCVTLEFKCIDTLDALPRKQATRPHISPDFPYPSGCNYGTPPHHVHCHNIPQQRKKQRHCSLLHFKSFTEKKKKDLILSKVLNMKTTEANYIADPISDANCLAVHTVRWTQGKKGWS